MDSLAEDDEWDEEGETIANRKRITECLVSTSPVAEYSFSTFDSCTGMDIGTTKKDV
jgi:hypothetical protein